MKKQNNILWGLFLLLGLSLSLVSCKKDDPDPEKEAKITAFAVTNAGGAGNVRIEGAINNLNILVAVPYETNVTALTVEVALSEGATVVPASGSTLDFTEARNFVVTNGDARNTYVVTVQKAEPTTPVISAIKAKSATTGEEYGTAVNLVDKKVTVTFNELQSTRIVIYDLEVLPAGTTYTTSTGKDTLDLAASSSITLSFAGEQAVYTFEANITEAGFNPTLTTTLLDRSAASGLVPGVIDNELSRGAAFNGRYVVAPSRKEGNHVYYWDVQGSGEPQELSMTGVSGGTWAVSDVQMVGNSIYVCNMVMNLGQEFKVYRWNGFDDETPEVVISFTTATPVSPALGIRIGDALSIIGDPATNGYIIASNFPHNNPQNQFYVWKFENGVPAAQPEIWTVTPMEGLRIGQYGRITEVPGEPDRYLVSGAEMGVAVINGQGQVLYEVPDVIIPYRNYEPRVFEYNGGRYLSYTINKEWQAQGAYMQVINITEGNGIVEALQGLKANNIAQKTVHTKIFGAIADGWISASNKVAFATDGKPRILSFTVLNGFIVQEFSR